MSTALQGFTNTINMTVSAVLYNSLLPLLLCLAFYVITSRGLKSRTPSIYNDIDEGTTKLSNSAPTEEVLGDSRTSSEPQVEEPAVHFENEFTGLNGQTPATLGTYAVGVLPACVASTSYQAEASPALNDGDFMIVSEVASTRSSEVHEDTYVVDQRDHSLSEPAALMDSTVYPGDAEDTHISPAEVESTPQTPAAPEEYMEFQSSATLDQQNVAGNISMLTMDLMPEQISPSSLPPTHSGADDVHDEGYASEGEAPSGDDPDHTESVGSVSIEKQAELTPESSKQKGQHDVDGDEVTGAVTAQLEEVVQTPEVLPAVAPSPRDPEVDRLDSDDEADTLAEREPPSDGPEEFALEPPDNRLTQSEIAPASSLHDASSSTSSHDAAHTLETLIDEDDTDPWCLEDDLPASTNGLHTELDPSSGSPAPAVIDDSVALDILDEDNPWDLDDEAPLEPEDPHVQSNSALEHSQTTTLPEVIPITVHEHTSAPPPDDDDEDPWSLDEDIPDPPEGPAHQLDTGAAQDALLESDTSYCESHPHDDPPHLLKLSINAQLSSTDSKDVVDECQPKEDVTPSGAVPPSTINSTESPTLAVSLSSQSERDLGEADAWDDPWAAVEDDSHASCQPEPLGAVSEDIAADKLPDEKIVLPHNPTSQTPHSFNRIIPVAPSPGTTPSTPAQPPSTIPTRHVEPHAHTYPESPLFREAFRSASPQLISPRPLQFPNISSISRPLRAHSPNHPNWAVAPPSPPPARSTPSPSLSTTAPSKSSAKRKFATRKSAPVGQRRGSWLALDHEHEAETKTEVVSSPDSPDFRRAVVAPKPVRVGTGDVGGYGRRHTMDTPDWAVAPSPSPDLRSDSPWSSGGETSGSAAIRRRK